jgi:molybdopterin-containing oxidoreductase family iron-sulfur binding subunit
MKGREVVRVATLQQYRKSPESVAPPRDQDLPLAGRAEEPLSMYDPFQYPPPQHRWGMAIDLTACVGCNACVMACQAENNIPVVGREQVLAGRIMHWLRIDRYVADPSDATETSHFQPVPCMHCEKAPCEVVCPVHATTHSPEGINEMTYNRCVGTRFCSNNCPYKVRRFNFYQYTDYGSEMLKLRANPEVSVRQRGVMEKCTYCVQRINNAQIDAQRLGRTLKDGDVVTACQAACPTEAIVFGDLHAPDSRVARYFKLPLNYSMLAELNTQPRTTYLATVRNPNPELERR